MSDRPNNAFLKALGETAFSQLSDSLRVVDLGVGRHLFIQGGEAEWVYFPESCLLSMISLNAGGQSVETAMVGREGASGLLEACGSGQYSVECVVQVDGGGWRAPAALVRKLTLSDTEFSSTVWKAVELQMAESRQSGLCQAMHPVEQRFCRWLLESLDRSGGRNPLPLTQEFIAAMLGVQRTTVSAFASQLQKDGLITYSRGRVHIDDVRGLERLACECRTVTKEQRVRLGFSL